MSIWSPLGYYRIVQGGSWFFNFQYARVSARFHYTPGHRRNDLGVRLVRRLP